MLKVGFVCRAKIRFGLVVECNIYSKSLKTAINEIIHGYIDIPSENSIIPLILVSGKPE